MYQITSQFILIPQNVSIEIIKGSKKDHSKLLVKGPNGHTHAEIKGHDINFINSSEDNKSYLEMTAKEKKMVSLTPLFIAIIKNAITGVTLGFSKELLLVGVGYKVEKKNDDELSFKLGRSHSITYAVDQNVKIECLSTTHLRVLGTNKQLVHQIASNLRSLAKPDSYRGKGIRYLHEIPKLKTKK